MNRADLRSSVSARLTLWNVSALAIILLALAFALREAADHNLLASVDRELARRAATHKTFWANVSFDPQPVTEQKPPRGWSDEERKRNREVLSAMARIHPLVDERVFNLLGRQSSPPFGVRPPLDRNSFNRAATGVEVYSDIILENDSIRLFSAPLRAKDGRLKGVAQISYSMVDAELALRNWDGTMLALMPVALLAVGLGGMLLTARMLRPVREMNVAVARMTAAGLSQRLEVNGEDEFSTLAANFNAMLGRLEAAFEQERRFISDASHELRTPLTVVKASSSIALADSGLSPSQRKSWEATDRAANLMAAIVEDLFLLARSDSGELALDLRPIPLCECVEASIETVAARRSTGIENRVHENVMVMGDRTHLIRLFVNLLENAIRHTPPDGRITVSAEAGRCVTAYVTDSGSGIAPEHLPHITERFYRAEECRSRASGGTGLGLAICQSIAAAHGGSLSIESTLGEGTTVQVNLPSAGKGGQRERVAAGAIEHA